MEFIWSGFFLVVFCLLSITPSYSQDLCTSEWTLMEGVKSEEGNQTDLMSLQECLERCEEDVGCSAVDFMSSQNMPCHLHIMPNYLDRQMNETMSKQYSIKRTCVPQEDAKLRCPPTWSLQMKKQPQLKGEATTHATLASCFNYCRLTSSCHAFVHDIKEWPPCLVFTEPVVTFNDDLSAITYLFERNDNCEDPETNQHSMGRCSNEIFPQTQMWCPPGTKVMSPLGSFKIHPLCCGKSHTSPPPLDSSSLSSFHINDIEYNKKINECLFLSNCTFEAQSLTRSYITNPFCSPKTSTNYVSISYHCLGEGVTQEIPVITPTPVLTHKAFPKLTKILISMNNNVPFTTQINSFLTANESGLEPFLTPPFLNQTESSKPPQQTDPMIVTSEIPPTQTDPMVETTKIPNSNVSTTKSPLFLTKPNVVTTKKLPENNETFFATKLPSPLNGTNLLTTHFVRNTPPLPSPILPNITFDIVTAIPPIIPDRESTLQPLTIVTFPRLVTTKTPIEPKSSSGPVFVPTLSPPIQTIPTTSNPINPSSPSSIVDIPSTTVNLLGVVTTTNPLDITTPKLTAVQTGAKENKTALVLGAIGTTFGILCLIALLAILYLVVYNTKKQTSDQWQSELIEKKHSPNQNYIGTSVA